jgi:hypothetical protein
VHHQSPFDKVRSVAYSSRNDTTVFDLVMPMPRSPMFLLGSSDAGLLTPTVATSPQHALRAAKRARSLLQHGMPRSAVEERKPSSEGRMAMDQQFATGRSVLSRMPPRIPSRRLVVALLEARSAREEIWRRPRNSRQHTPKFVWVRWVPCCGGRAPNQEAVVS